MISFIKRRPYLLILGLILIIGIFLRTFDLVGRAHFDHDSDLFSWIVKDIIIDHHFRLIGQLTSAPGIFIGPYFYYLLVPFFILFKMDPIAASYLITIFGLLTLISYYFVFSKLFNNKVGLIVTLLYAVLLPNIDFDRRVVPSTPANLWTVWYFFTVLSIARGNYNVLPLLGVLIGLIWHIHIALIPALIAIPVAFFVSGKLPTKKQVAYFIISLLLTSIPLLAFELRHHFSQTLSLIENFSSVHAGRVGIYKFFEVLDMISKNTSALFLYPQSLPEKFRLLFTISLFLVGSIISLNNRLITRRELLPLLFWIFGIIAFFTFSSSLISEYYFYNLGIIFFALTGLTFYFIYESSKLGKILVIMFLTLLTIKSIYFYTTSYIYHKGYLEKKAVVDFIQQDANKMGFPCVGISYITTPGENAGFRYLFYLNKAHLVHPSLDIPVYNIVIPEELSKEVTQKFGHIGVIPPTTIPSKEIIEKSCQTPDTNLTDSMFGYVD
ncbi:MAG: glycosyltransferase family 39 protein [Candidatus Daviesbacteria bacterium]|nr:glycosyltransferase family 39 protein [Candidatus Daviesbacteria bacterium]